MEKRYIDASCLNDIVAMVDEHGEAYVPVSAIRRAISSADSVTIKINEEKGEKK